MAGGQLAPEAAALLAAAPPRPERRLLTVAENREGLVRASQLFSPGAAVAQVRDTTLPGRAGPVPVRIYRSAEDDQPVLVYLHGGGWALGSLDTHDSICRNLAAWARCAVVSVDYRQPPEHRFPAAVHDALDVVQQVLDDGDRLGLDRRRVGVGGDSAGGNLAAVVAQQLRHEPGLVHQVLLIPALDARPDEWRSYQEFATGTPLARSDMEWYFEQYCGPDGADPQDPLLAPWACSDLQGLPAATIVTAECDPLRDEGEAYAARLRQAGVPVVLHRASGMFHPFVLYGDRLSAAREAQELVADRLREAWL